MTAIAIVVCCCFFFAFGFWFFFCSFVGVWVSVVLFVGAELFDSLLLLSLLLLPFSFLIGLYSYTVCLSFIVFKWDENSFFFFW